MKEIKFIDVGEGITEGHVRKWLVADGAIVREDDPIVKVETDKAIVDVPAPISGIVKINAKEKTDVHIGDTIAYIGTPEELKNINASGLTQTQPIPQKPLPISVQNPIKNTGDIIATPSVRKLARDIGIDITKIKGSGPSGRILESDLKQTSVPTQQNMKVERVQMSQLRKAVARNMEESAKIPRAVSMDLMKADLLYNTVESLRGSLESKYGIKLTFLPFIVKAVIAALIQNPRFNASYDASTGEIVLKKYYNIGLAAASEEGLRVIVLKEADTKSIVQLAKEIQELHEKIKNNTITLEDMHDSTFTITNVGSLGGGYLSVPIINPPEVAILGVHMLRDEPVVDGKEIKIGKILPLSLSFDHRVVDGADAIKFINTIMENLQDLNFMKI